MITYVSVALSSEMPPTVTYPETGRSGYYMGGDTGLGAIFFVKAVSTPLGGPRR